MICGMDNLGWYVETAPWPVDAERRRAAKSRLCQMSTARDVESALTVLWSNKALQRAA